MHLGKVVVTIFANLDMHVCKSVHKGEETQEKQKLLFRVTVRSGTAEEAEAKEDRSEQILAVRRLQELQTQRRAEIKL